MRYFGALVVLLPLLCMGCTYKAWYQGLQDTRRQECYRLPQGEVQPCLDEVDRVGYEQYRREREEAQDEGTATEQAPGP